MQGWTDFKSFTSPANTDNRCNNDQKSGFDWNELPIGDFDSYGQFGFSGFKCADSFRDKRDVLTPRNFQVSGRGIHEPDDLTAAE
jgi:hypothetical protein